ncbi:SPOR domain-containing protein [Streptomyces sp. RKND-216]|uniref:SPOR domain-containing protein n=1 Tax=Streptomyces sp. RKND-216 TaxID=2562581 RepID=UPI00109E1C48|nr:SPOR domain-containing protein [Streptomyces sp. RKND-216]THA25161.1 SPOR domain-containing protein [Streptomyces sp. RKND-216]
MESARLRGAGHSPDTERVTWPRGSDRSGLLGVRVRVGTFEEREGADALQRALAADGFDAIVEWTGSDGNTGTGETRVNVAVVDPRRFGGSLAASHGEGVAGREKVTDMAAAGMSATRCSPSTRASS